MRPWPILAGLAGGVAGLVLAPTPAGALPVPAGPLTWSDEFAGTALDGSKWQINEPGTWDDAENTAQAVSVGGGHLKIGTYTQSGTHYTAVLGTQDTALFTYGYFEARIRFDSSPGMWSAFWLLSPTLASAPNDPANAGTEIDIAEHRAVNDMGLDRTAHLTTAVHWGGYGPDHQAVTQLHGPLSGLSNGTWHRYGLLWTADHYAFYFDDQLIWTRTTEISQRSEYLLLSSHVDDGGWAGNIPGGGYGSQASSTTDMLVDYVRVYSVPEPGALAGLALLGALCRRRRKARSR